MTMTCARSVVAIALLAVTACSSVILRQDEFTFGPGSGCAFQENEVVEITLEFSALEEVTLRTYRTGHTAPAEEEVVTASGTVSRRLRTGELLDLQNTGTQPATVRWTVSRRGSD